MIRATRRWRPAFHRPSRFRRSVAALLLALAAAVLLHVGIIVVVNLLGHALHLDAVEKASMIYSNAGNLIIPIVTAVLARNG